MTTSFKRFSAHVVPAQYEAAWKMSERYKKSFPDAFEIRRDYVHGAALHITGQIIFNDLVIERVDASMKRYTKAGSLGLSDYQVYERFFFDQSEKRMMDALGLTNPTTLGSQIVSLLNILSEDELGSYRMGPDATEAYKSCKAISKSLRGSESQIFSISQRKNRGILASNRTSP